MRSLSTDFEYIDNLQIKGLFLCLLVSLTKLYKASPYLA